ncbi:GNAT family N-acetyltransferase [Halorussus amylolyticus]|uniref:GNAT family N-acetyltransferase n=1 Tax=Halorussus amylolyticus TaxID=1126242 RepID=UPI00104E9D5D|nr:GNAT family N-acetyltransferase [Halorussus amylolyticus]
MFPERIETERLVFEPLTTENVDVLEFYEFCSHHNPNIGEITEYLSWDPHETPKETEEFLELCEEAWNETEGASYLVRPKEGEDGAGEIAGATGLDVNWDRRTGVLGAWLRKPFWGRGYSGERAAALMEVAFDRLDLEVVAVTHHDGNDKSRRAIEKYVERFGGRHEGLLRNFHAGEADPDPVDAHRYTVSREEWERNR